MARVAEVAEALALAGCSLTLRSAIGATYPSVEQRSPACASRTPLTTPAACTVPDEPHAYTGPPESPRQKAVPDVDETRTMSTHCAPPVDIE